MKQERLRMTPSVKSVESAKRDVGLIAAYLQGDETAFTKLVMVYQPIVQAIIFRVTGDREQAEDLAQETFLKVFKHMARFDQTAMFSTWIHTIAKNLARNELRDRRRSTLVYMNVFSKENDLLIADYSLAPDRMLEKSEARAIVAYGLGMLPEHHREVFSLREIYRMSYNQIAERVGCGIGTVKSRLNRARTAFRNEVGKMM